MIHFDFLPKRHDDTKEENGPTRIDAYTYSGSEMNKIGPLIKPIIRSLNYNVRKLQGRDGLPPFAKESFTELWEKGLVRKMM